MLEGWARAYAERWGLPEPALAELGEVLAAVARGDIADGDATTLLQGAIDPDDETTLEATVPIEVERGSDVGRYEDIGHIGIGGMGEVRRVWDLTLHRAVAMKILRSDLVDRNDLRARFQEEAEATAQLEHPGIVPIHDLGQLPDGRLFFTMKEVRGRTLLDVIDELHAASVDRWGTTATGWTLFRVMQVFVTVCEAIAYAHSRGVVHRDLKPTNIMVGPFGEVAVMDWGLAKVASQQPDEGDSAPVGSRPVLTQRAWGTPYVTRSGAVAGTPNYMPPEQARGDHPRVGSWSDVYALGAILYHILADRPPYEGHGLEDVVEQVLTGPPPPPEPGFPPAGPEEPDLDAGLRAICAVAMSRAIEDRYMDATALAEAVSEWIVGAGVREQALAMVARADALKPEMDRIQARITRLRAQAARLLEDVPETATVDDKAAGWQVEDEAARLAATLSSRREQVRTLLRAALAHAPDLPEALQRLGDRVPDQRAPQPRARLTLRSAPTGASVHAHRLEMRHRRIVPGDPHLLGVTPLEGLELAPGSYLLTLRHGDGPPVRYPVRIRAGGHWIGARPGSTTPEVVRLPDRPEPDGCYVPAGWYTCGGDRETDHSLPSTRVWVDGYTMARHPVTNAAFRRFLLADPQPQWAPSHRGQALWAAADGWALPAGWHDDQPVRGISWEAACAYARWWASETGLPWRLPHEHEWEKAARGVDGRAYPWGDYLDPTWSCVLTSHTGTPAPAPVKAFPDDVSPYGVRGLGGNVQDWVIGHMAGSEGDDAGVEIADRTLRGGHFAASAMHARSTLRFAPAWPTSLEVGFRLARTTLPAAG